MAIDLTFDDLQQQRQLEARDFFSERCPTSVVRDLEVSAAGYQPDLWQEMAERGWLGLTFPSAYGGGDGTFLDVYPLYEEMGRFLVPSPHLDTVAIAGDVILRTGSESQKQQVLPAIAEGRCLVSVATLEPSGVFGPSGVATTAVRQNGAFTISGTKLLVAFAGSADYLLVPARTTGQGVTLFLLDARSKGISSARLVNIAGGALYQVDFDQVPAPEDTVVGEAGDGWGALSLSATKAAVLQTASIVGAARAVLEMTNQYAKDRVQFGSPIGAYQAVQYMVTDILIDTHSTDLLAKQAAYLIAAGRPFAAQAAMAIAGGKKAAAHLHRQAHEVHAGMGFMVEHDLQLFSRRSKFWENNLGDARHHQEQLAQAMRL
jgi:alkylation response protein AidB-like acyl-CoA dehydrogenase